jgi:hypothetical protein
VFSIRNKMAAAALAAVAVFGLTAQNSPQKKVKDQAEFVLYTEAFQSVDNPSRQIEVLDRWTARYPDSDYRDDRLYLYMQAYARSTPPQPAKAIEYGRQLMARGLEKVFPGPGGMLNVVTVLYRVAWAAAGLPTADAQQLAAGEQAARALLEIAPRYFAAENRPADRTEDQWAAARADLENRARKALVAIGLAPGTRALEGGQKDCQTAENVFTRMLAAYPDNALVAYSLATALDCQARNQPDRALEFSPRAIYLFVRAAELDASLGGTVDPAKIKEYAAAAYRQYHGGEDGLAALREQVKTAPQAPPGFTIETAASVARRKEQEFAEKNPQVAFWLRIRAQLAEPNGQQYFDGQMKDLDIAGKAGARALKGKIVEGRPECRPRELYVSVDGSRTEIALRLDGPLSGKATGDIEWDGIPRVFTRDPFLLTMDVPRTRISGLTVGPCGK